MNAPPVVLLQGDESFLVDRELKALEAAAEITSPEDMNRQVFDASESNVGEVVNSAKTIPFLGSRRLIIVKGADKWNASQWDTLTAYLEKPNPSTTLVLIAEKLDKRRAYWKTLKKAAHIVECAKPSDSELTGWIRRISQEAGFEVGANVAQSLVLRVGPDLQLLYREILKLQVFAGEKGRVTVEDVEVLVGESRGTTVFVLCDALGMKQLGPSLKALRKLLELGEAPVKIIYMIARHFRILTKARYLKERGGRVTPGEAASALGVPPFVARKAMDQAARWSRARLDKVVRDLLHADYMLKSGGKEEVVEKLIIDLCT
ncbi:MAG: DNA polymerase III subunit delta [Deltaproteobacteria bacterium]|nr:MAG: DNA polymerase III subunit delta [Deltaproteobacteria bacterium]